MKRNFRYITKFEEEARSARPERRDNAYKSVVNSYFENVGIFYENDEVNVIDDKHATTKVPQTIGGWQNSWNSKQFEVPVGLPCRPATNLPQEGWWLDHTAPKVKAFIKKVIAMQVEHPEFEKNSSSARLEKRGYGLKATDVIGYAWEGELLTVEFVKHLFKTKQVEFDADSLTGRKDMNGIPEGLTANGEEYMPIFGSTELDESDRKMLEEGRSSSARLETRAKTPKRFSARMNPSGGTWDITVETEGGKTVYEYQFPDNSNGADPEDEQTSLIDDGFLKHTTDYKGLANYMVHIGVMQSGDELFKEGDLTGDLKHHATGWVGRSSSARLETRELDAFNEQHLRKWIEATVAGADEFTRKEIDIIYDHMVDTYEKDPDFWADQGWSKLGEEVEVFALASKLRKQQ